jgi:tetratricopeptide (TPR) repeat protein
MIRTILILFLAFAACMPSALAEHPGGYADAMKLYAAAKYAPAAAKFDAIAKSGHADADTHYYLGACYQALQKYDAALTEYDWVAKNGKLFTEKRKGAASAAWIRSCRAGICPGNCLKINDPRWQSQAGSNLKWIKFYYSKDGGSGWNSWSTNHLGEVIESVNGVPTNKGKCTICGGTGRVAALR